MMIRFVAYLFFAFLSLLGFVGLACAQTTIGVHLVSHHTPTQNLAGEDFSNVNPGLYASLSNGLTAGAYRNSEFRNTVYAGWTSPEWNRFSMLLGAATGYTPPLIPFAALTARVLTIGDYSARLAYLPKVEATGANIFHLSVEKVFP